MMARIAIWMGVFLAGSAIAQSPPPGFVPPALHPEGVTLRTVALGEDVYALMSSQPPVDNAGFIVGEKGVLVIDAHINEAMAHQIQDAVRTVTDKPILYLVNTNYLGDHTFGNYAFPDSTIIVAHRNTRESMRDFEARKIGLAVTVRNDPAVFAIAKLRLPDIVFNNFLEFDLGGRVVELHFFGGGNTDGDTVVYVPEAKIAWTGNMVFGDGSLPFLIAGKPARYAKSLARFADTLEIEKIVPGHGIITNSATIARYIDYLDSLVVTVKNAHDNNWSLSQTLEHSTLPVRFQVAPELSAADFYSGLHPFNIQRHFLESKQ